MPLFHIKSPLHIEFCQILDKSTGYNNSAAVEVNFSRSYANQVNRLPVNAHLLVALIAPRPLLLQTGDTDYWPDTKVEFLVAYAAETVYNLFGK
jgi:hypothetical protein